MSLRFRGLGFRVHQLRIEQSLVEPASWILEKHPPTSRESTGGEFRVYRAL